MSSIPNNLRILASLRRLHLPSYFEILGLLYPNADERDATQKVTQQFAEKLGDGLFTELTPLLATAEYRGLIDQLNDLDGSAALRIQTLLETKEYEIRLTALKESSLQEYIDALRVVSEEELVAAIVDGTVVNAIDQFGGPLPIPADENYSGSFLDTPTATAWVDAATLVRVLNFFSAPSAEVVPSAKGLRLRQVVIGGDTLDLNWLKIPFPLGFEGCDFHSWVWAEHLEVPWLSFESCDFTPREQAFHRIGAINAQHLRVTHDLRFWECRGFKQLFIPGATIGSFSLRDGFSPSDAEAGNAEAGNAEASDTPQQPTYTTVIDGAHFGSLHVPDEDLLPLKLDSSISVDQIDGDYQAIRGWLEHTDAEGIVWDNIADAFTRSGRGRDALALRIDFRRFQNSHRNPIWRFFIWLFGDFTVRYFHQPFRAIGLLAATFVVTWILAFFFHGELIKSPLANDPIPSTWLTEWTSTAAWSFMYALDSTFSPLSLGQIDTMWPSSVWLVLALAALKAISIILLGLFIAAATNLVSKRTG